MKTEPKYKSSVETNKKLSNVKSTVKTNKTKLKEFNRFDRIVESNNYQSKLENDIYLNELRFGLSSNEETDKKKNIKRQLT